MRRQGAETRNFKWGQTTLFFSSSALAGLVSSAYAGGGLNFERIKGARDATNLAGCAPGKKLISSRRSGFRLFFRLEKQVFTSFSLK
jgi:hypothetical protein